MLNEDFSLGTYLKKINDLYSVKDNQTLTDTLNNFRQISKTYNELDNFSKEDNFKYSSYNYLECSKEEQDDFFNNVLQLVECLVINSIYEKTGLIWNWKDIFSLLLDETYKNVDKINRKVVYSTSFNQRPIGDQSYMIWNGLQIIDLDIKDEELSTKLKPLIFDELKKYNWFLGICRSASKKSLHIWTKITPLSYESNNRKVEYLCNFRHKYSYIYIILSKLSSQFHYNKEDIIKYMDMAMAKPQQGIFISSDETALLNTNFKDLRLDVNFESAFISGVESINWISHPDLKDIFHKLEWFNTDRETDDIDVSNISGINDRDETKKNKIHYKHAQRWQLANTLTSIYGYDKALKIMVEICRNTEYKELAGDVKTASIHNKPISTWAIKELNKNHGFNLKIKSEELYNKEIEVLNKKIEDSTDSTDPIKIINESSKKVNLYLKHNQYLSDIKEDIIKNLSHITLLEAGAGYGKTEMIKALSEKTMLILPFTSTIKAKVESSEVTKDWLYFYGNSRPTLEEILGNKNMSMTIDKFSRLNIMELDQADFEYIVIDESHLLFTSSYRDVMAPTIQRLANCKAKIIMMTGTPTGEMLFFPGIKHIKVTKEDFRNKEFEIHMFPTKDEKLVEMCKMMAKDIYEGKKILYPTNKGTLYFEQISGLIQSYLDDPESEYSNFDRKINTFYYKKSNYGDESMDSINIDKSIGNNDVIFCTTYLSVGVDICDKYTFSVYFNEPWIAQDIEQFANRLRNNDLYIKLLLEKEDSTGWAIDYYHVQPLDLSISQKDLLIARDLIKACNDTLERNQEESKYSPMIQSLLSANRYLKYDENDCKYYIDETTYKLRVFEDRYSEYSKQLEVMINGMKYYGYKISRIDHTDRIPESKIEWLENYLKSCRHIRFDWWTKQTFKFLDHLSEGNIDVYRDLLKGDYALFKDTEYKEDRESNNLYAESIEVLEKNLPIVLTLYRFYDIPTIIDIFKYCVDKKQNKLNYSKLDRIRRFIIIEANRRKNRIDFPIYKYLKETQKYSKDHPEVSKEEIQKYIASYAVKYANSIKDVSVDDKELLEQIYEALSDLWKVIIIQTRVQGRIHIKPFTLLWENKDSLQNIYGTAVTKEFFEQLMDDMKEVETTEFEEELPELEHTAKVTQDDIKEELPNVIHKEFDYYIYSEKDKSNERYLDKQKKQSRLNPHISIENNTNKEEENTNKTNIDGLLPFEFEE